MRPQIQTLLQRMRPVLSKRLGAGFGVWGEPGIGKSFEVEALLQAMPCKTVRVHATWPLSTWVAPLQTPQTSNNDGFLGQAIKRIANNEPLPPQNTTDVILGALEKIGPIVLHLEDTHETTPERQALIAHMLERVAFYKGVAVLLTSRAPLEGKIFATELLPLTRQEVIVLLENQAGSTLPESAHDWIWEKALGNPLFCLEYFRQLTSMGALWSDGKRWHWRDPNTHPMPTTLEALLEQHLSRVMVSAEAQQVLLAKAILPLGFAETMWQRVTGLSHAVFATVCQTLEQHGVLRGAEFVHPLLREVVQGGLGPSQRQHWALRAIEALDKDHPEDAAQFLEDAALPNAQVFEVLQRAASAAKARGDEVMAARFLARSVPHAADEKAGEWALLAAQGLRQHDIAEAARLAKIALQTPNLVPQALPILCGVLGVQGDIPALEEVLKTHGRPSSEISSWRILGHQMAGQHAEVLEMWESEASIQNNPIPQMLYIVVLSYLATGRVPQAQVVLAQGRSLNMTDEERHDFDLLEAFMHMNLSQFAQAVPLFEKAIRFHRPRADKRKLGGMLHNLGVAHKELLNFEEAQKAMQESLAIRRGMGDLNPAANTLSALAEILLELGLQTQAEDAIEESLQISQRYPPSHFLVNVYSQASFVYAGQVTPLAKLMQQKYANKGYGLALAMNNLKQQQELLYDQAVAYTRNGDPRAALSCVQAMAVLAPQTGDPPAYQWRALYAKALALEALGDLHAARDALVQAHGVVKDSGNELYIQKILLEQDRLDGNAEAATTRLAWFEQRGFRRAADLVRSYFPHNILNTTQASQTEASVRTQHRLDLLGAPLLDSVPLRGQKRQLCLVRLAEAKMSGRDGVAKLELLDSLYPDEDEFKGAGSLKQLVRSLREASSDRLILTTPTGYALGDVELDVEVFLQTKKTSLWRGTYTQGVEHASAESALADVLYDTLMQQMMGIATSDQGEAARLTRILLEGDPYNQEYLRLALRVLQNVDQPKTALRVFESAQERFAELGEVLPKTWQEFLNAEVGV